MTEIRVFLAKKLHGDFCIVKYSFFHLGISNCNQAPNKIQIGTRKDPKSGLYNTQRAYCLYYMSMTSIKTQKILARGPPSRVSMNCDGQHNNNNSITYIYDLWSARILC